MDWAFIGIAFWLLLWESIRIQQEYELDRKQEETIRRRLHGFVDGGRMLTGRQSATLCRKEISAFERSESE